MRLFKRIAGLLGLGKDEDQQHRDGDAAAEATAPPPFSAGSAAAATASAQHLPRRGFSVPVQVPVERDPPAPLLLFCPSGDGEVQGLRWYARRLKMDEDGDVADEFLDEVSPDTLRSVGAQSPAPRFEVKNSTKPVKVKNLELLPNGKIHHLVEHHGKLEWL
ncbi:uncharacterized protein LOC125205714 [Salvia hispanica]|uniref:uncharacterized protein LOC125205714 n=1 Tax=Salvia hispanica TaxID=49212 RepID=UPI0020090B32|nr:uncharacterized protein LOC125205714 [Salvia hispanica]